MPQCILFPCIHRLALAVTEEYSASIPDAALILHHSIHGHGASPAVSAAVQAAFSSAQSFHVQRQCGTSKMPGITVVLLSCRVCLGASSTCVANPNSDCRIYSRHDDKLHAHNNRCLAARQSHQQYLVFECAKKSSQRDIKTRSRLLGMLHPALLPSVLDLRQQRRSHEQPNIRSISPVPACITSTVCWVAFLICNFVAMYAGLARAATMVRSPPHRSFSLHA